MCSGVHSTARPNPRLAVAPRVQLRNPAHCNAGVAAAGAQFSQHAQKRVGFASYAAGSSGATGPQGAKWGWRSRAALAGFGAAVVAGAAGGTAFSQAFSPDRGGELESQHIGLVKEVVGSDTLFALLTTSTLLSGETPLSADHFFSNLIKNDMVNDLHCYFDAEQQQFHSLIELGSDVCGHPTIVHGGLTAAIIDEAFGGLIFCLKRWKLLGPGPPFTVKLEVEYHKPLKASTTVICSTELLSVEGRKVWMKATVRDTTSNEAYATGKALFVTPRIKIQKPWTIAAWAQSILMFWGP